MVQNKQGMCTDVCGMCVCGVRVPQTQAELILSSLHSVPESIHGVISSDVSVQLAKIKDEMGKL